MSAWLYLVLAHLVADFVLQPYPLVKLKERPAGLALHAAIHGLITAAVAVPLLPRGWLLAGLVTVMHYAIDHAKGRSGLTRGPVSLVVFFLDQAVHLTALAGVVLAAGLPLRGEPGAAPPELAAVLYYAIPYIAVTFAGAITLYQLAVAYGTRPRPEELLMPIARIAGYAERGTLLTLVLFTAPVFWALAALWCGVRFVLARGRAGRLAEAAGSLALTLVFGLLFRQGLPR